MKGNSFFHLIKVFFKIDSQATQTTQSERDALIKYLPGAVSAIEIGVYEGVNTVLIAKNIEPTGKLYGIDPFFKGSLGICYHKYISLLNLKRNKVRNKVVLIQKLSFDASANVPEEVDFIFIDGDHTFEGVEKDWQIYSKKVKWGGIIALHDTSVPDFDPNRKYLGSVRYFNEIIFKSPYFEIIETIDSLNILKRIA
jgi:predicted O-methyltransferase YrrM